MYLLLNKVGVFLVWATDPSCEHFAQAGEASDQDAVAGLATSRVVRNLVRLR
jgi:hypothetical protein